MKEDHAASSVPPMQYNERGRALNDDVAALESEVEAQKRETEVSWMAKIQRVEELSRSTRVTDALLLCIHVVGVDIANCECERQTARYDRVRFDCHRSKLTKFDRYPRGSGEY
jgi:hypothetical protein